MPSNSVANWRMTNLLYNGWWIIQDERNSEQRRKWRISRFLDGQRMKLIVAFEIHLVIKGLYDPRLIRVSRILGIGDG